MSAVRGNATAIPAASATCPRRSTRSRSSSRPTGRSPMAPSPRSSRTCKASPTSTGCGRTAGSTTALPALLERRDLDVDPHARFGRHGRSRRRRQRDRDVQRAVVAPHRRPRRVHRRDVALGAMGLGPRSRRRAGRRDRERRERGAAHARGREGRAPGAPLPAHRQLGAPEDRRLVHRPKSSTPSGPIPHRCSRSGPKSSAT